MLQAQGIHSVVVDRSNPHNCGDRFKFLTYQPKACIGADNPCAWASGRRKERHKVLIILIFGSLMFFILILLQSYRTTCTCVGHLAHTRPISFGLTEDIHVTDVARVCRAQLNRVVGNYFQTPKFRKDCLEIMKDRGGSDTSRTKKFKW